MVNSRRSVTARARALTCSVHGATLVACDRAAQQERHKSKGAVTPIKRAYGISERRVRRNGAVTGRRQSNILLRAYESMAVGDAKC